jgi:N-formylglutamate deformylase
VPLPYLGRDRRVLALMIELRRDLYMDEASGVRGAAFPACAAAIQDALRRIIA